MRYADLERKWGTQQGIADALGLDHRQTVNKWAKTGIVPLAHQITAEIASGGELSADIPDALRKPRRGVKERKATA